MKPPSLAPFTFSLFTHHQPLISISPLSASSSSLFCLLTIPFFFFSPVLCCVFSPPTNSRSNLPPFELRAPSIDRPLIPRFEGIRLHDRLTIRISSFRQLHLLLVDSHTLYDLILATSPCVTNGVLNSPECASLAFFFNSDFNTPSTE